MAEIIRQKSKPALSWAWLHPLLFAVWPSLFLYSHCQATVPVGHMLRPAAFSLALMCCLLGIVRLKARDFARGALIVSLLCLGFFSYGYIAGSRFGWHHLILCPLFVGLLGIGLWALARSAVNVFLWTKAANVMALFLIVSALLMGGAAQIRTLVQAASRETEAEKSADMPSLFPALGYWPDIYYIVLDSYARSDVLRQRYGLDNTDFLHALRQRGFYIATQSYANYSHTDYSLSSALNMGYVPSGQPLSPRLWLAENRVARWLKACGYEIVTFSSYWELLEAFPADKKWGPPTLSAFETKLLSLSLFFGGVSFAALAGLESRLPCYTAKIYLETVYVLENLSRHRVLSPSAPRRPRFVFAHIWSPHPPFVFDEQGRYVPQWPAEPTFRAGYPAAIKFLSRRLIKAIDDIFTHSPHPPVIIVQGDHGSRELYMASQGEIARWEDVYPILNAYFIPGGGAKHLWPHITPVNSFRVVFKHCLGAKGAYLPEMCFFIDKDKIVRLPTPLRLAAQPRSKGRVQRHIAAPLATRTESNAGRKR